ncbi:helix-turn-helix domain-containing protein [Sphingobacterium corticis]|uniref:Helix-turn-helix domain-containing protein n=1 Tax=Sphingobacterium corticis TaxID=1812823 RepID=A0ABW5NJ02_9SPHI
MKIDFVSREELAALKAELLKEIKDILKEKVNGGISQQWFRSADVRKLLGISAGTLQNFRINGTLPYRKVGGIMFYSRADILDLMQGRDNG